MHHVPDPRLVIVLPPNRALTKVFSHVAVECSIAQTIVSVGRKPILVKNNRSTDGSLLGEDLTLVTTTATAIAQANENPVPSERRDPPEIINFGQTPVAR